MSADALDPVRIQNLSRRPVVVSLNSRRTLRLSPSASAELASVEIQNNAEIKKLSARGVIVVSEAARDEGDSSRRKSERKPTRA